VTRLLYFVNIPRFFLSHRLPLALAARDAGYDVHVTTSDADTASVQGIIETGLPYHPLALAQHGTQPLTELRTQAAIIRLYRRLQPDLVHQVSIKPVIYGGLAARLTGVRGVVSAMSGLGRVYSDDDLKARLIQAGARPAFKLALAGRTRMIFQNDDDRQHFLRLGLIAPERTALIRGSGVDMARFRPTPEADGLPVVLFAGRLMWRKGLGDFVEAARALRGQARFVVVGYAEATSPDAVPADQIRAWADEGIVEAWGRRDDMPTVFAGAHIVCLPSTYGEGVPKVLIEAAACARAIVTTDTPGCRDIARDGVNGLLVPPGDTGALITALRALIADPERRRALGAAGRHIAERDFALQTVIDQTFAVYQAALA